MIIQINIEENVVVVEVQGKLMGGPETDECHKKMKYLIEEGHQQIVIDLSRVEWVNSSGLGMLVACYTSCRNAGGYFKIAGATEKTKSLLTMTKLITVLESFENTEQAIGSFRY
ncbi:STAS domain-containing protein [bacterium]|jgi:anti-sigma B factor antagonist|nr:STAS domain-containing protein [bacterium]